MSDASHVSRGEPSPVHPKGFDPVLFAARSHGCEVKFIHVCCRGHRFVVGVFFVDVHHLMTRGTVLEIVLLKDRRVILHLGATRDEDNHRHQQSEEPAHMARTPWTGIKIYPDFSWVGQIKLHRDFAHSILVARVALQPPLQTMPRWRRVR